jgi:DNA repair protein RadC
MPEYCAAHRVPRPDVDVLGDAATALALLHAMMASPPRSETIAILLDAERRGISVFVVNGTTAADAVLDVIEVIGAATHVDDVLDGVVLASVRPGGGVEPGDIDRWLGASDTLERRGVELVEWFVIGRAVECPRDLLGAPPRW